MGNMKNAKMKGKALFASLLAFSLLAACSGETPSSSSPLIDPSSGETPSSPEASSSEIVPYVDHLPENVSDGVILHCFDWTFEQIESQLDTIAGLGYRAIQTSPVTQPKDHGSIWYYFYQPCSYSIATSSPLGGKEELVSLCQAAEEKGIAVLVDVVFNHMATTGATNSDGTPEVDPEVAEYEPYIYENRETLFHHETNSNLVTQCYPGLPDIDTSNEYIQERSLSLLKECIDAGVDGFRFDAAKHIETPDDEQYPSDFWPNTLGVAKEYYKEKTGNELFAYGEILGAAGTSQAPRPIGNYTKHMKVTANDYGEDVAKQLFYNRSPMIGSLNMSYRDSSPIIWGESHDTVLHDETNWTFDELVKLWAVISARKGAQSLFFARSDTDDDSCTVGKIGNFDWNSPYFAVSNKFHNRFVEANEYQSYKEGVYISERYSESDCGALLVDVKEEESTEISFRNLADGTYYDQFTGKEVVIAEGKATIAFPEENKGVIYLTRDFPDIDPILTVSHESGTYIEPFELTLSLQNATDATISINDGEPIHWSGSYSLTIGDDEEGTTKISIWYTNGTKEGRKELTFTKLALVEGYFNIVNLDPEVYSNYEVYVWSWSPSTWGKPYTYDEATGNLLIPDETVSTYTGFLLALFEKGHEITNLTAWDSACLKQTSDIDPSAGYFDASDFRI